MMIDIDKNPAFNAVKLQTYCSIKMRSRMDIKGMWRNFYFHVRNHYDYYRNPALAVGTEKMGKL